MLTINTTVDAGVAVNAGSQSPVSVDQHPLVSCEFGDKADQLPRGTALNAARSPRAKTPRKDNVRSTALSRQPTGKNSTTALSRQSTTKSSPLSRQPTGKNSTTPLSRQPTSKSSPAPAPPANNGSEDPASDEAPTDNRKAADLARIAARRVNVWKKSEQDRLGEEERARQVKADQDKRRQNHAAQAKQRRRAEIYALNALLRELQQEKIANFIAAQKQLECQQMPTGCREEALMVEHIALAQVQAIGA
ncbi:hypothetical protein PHYBOEH_004783 [Phytophthora boehmeriae]|uniref:Uncharacterized protein n=1 Tax=Phytophthora boehmeriae TaxID=109152 RepID=A0A8T1WMU4_9STRA|nr:hypothetical protein PHYBOEH_004783 [Phytophthora boehmeriae]